MHVFVKNMDILVRAVTALGPPMAVLSPPRIKRIGRPGSSV